MMNKRTIFKVKISSLMIVSLVGTIYFVNSTMSKEFLEQVYYCFFLYPLVFAAMSAGIPVSYMADLILKKKGNHLIYSAIVHLSLCFLIFFVPYVLINKEINTFVIFYFLIIPVIYSFLNSVFYRRRMKQLHQQDEPSPIR